MEQATTSAKVVSVSEEPNGVALIHLNRPPANSYDRGFVDDLNAAIH
jgi:enoyl-CoA hydratase/carnithine racemase